MDRFRTALQLYKDQNGHPGTRPQAGKTSAGQALPPPIVLKFHSLCCVNGG